MFPRHVWAQCTPNLKYSWEWGQPQGTHVATAPCCSHATRWSWGQQFRQHWTMTGPLPHPAELEFALLSNSSGFKAKLIPKLPLLLLPGLCLGLWGGQTPSVLPCLAHHPSHVPLGHPWSTAGAGAGRSQDPACLLSTVLGYSLGSPWHAAEPRQDVAPSRSWGSSPAPQLNRAGSAPRWGSSSSGCPCPEQPPRLLKAFPALVPRPSLCPEALGKVPPWKQSPGGRTELPWPGAAGSGERSVRAARPAGRRAGVCPCGRQERVWPMPGPPPNCNRNTTRW